MSPKNFFIMPSKSGLRFTFQSYRQMLNAWKVTDESNHGYDCIARKDPKTNSTNNESNSRGDEKKSEDMDNTVIEVVAKKSGPSGDHTIDILDISIDSIPETPEFARKATKTKKTKSKKKSTASSFIDMEANDDSFGDDIEELNDENIYSQTDIDNSTQRDSQPIGQLYKGIDSRDTKDMHSVYLRSVKDREVGKYKLQYNYDPTVEVYSQEPTEEEMCDYEMDSFCVPNDCVIFEDSPAPEVIEMDSSSPKRRKRLRSSKRKFKRIIFSP